MSNEFKNPLDSSNLFHTPKNMQELEAYIQEFTVPEERALATLIMAMTWNLASKVIDETISQHKGD